MPFTELASTASCLSDESLAAFAEGALAGRDAERVAAHADACSGCRRVLSALAELATATSPRSAAAGATAPAGAAPVAPGAAIGRYVVLRRLGAGAMGVVWLAYDPELDRRVALKLLGGATTPATEARLAREGRAMARLTHEHVVAVHDVGRAGDRTFIAMQWIDGQTLRTWAEAERPGWRAVCACGVAAARGLAAAHAAGLVHRDVKPDNLFVARDGRVLVGDFGLAEPVASALGDGAGTPAYMAPEQLRGEPADAATDQFNLAATLWELVYGERAFAGASLADRAAGRARLRVPARSSLPPRVRRVLARALAPAPAERHADVAAFAEALGAAARRRAPRVLAAVVAVAAAAGLAVRALAPAAVPVLAIDPCAGAVAAWSPAWSETRREALATRLAGAAGDGRGHAGEVTRSLDRYAGALAELAAQSCRATRVWAVQSEALLDRKLACLAERRDGFEGLVANLEHEAPDATRALAAVRDLGDLEACQDDEALGGHAWPPGVPRAEVRALRAALATAETGRRLQPPAALVGTVVALVTRAERLGDRASAARATLLLGHLHRDLGQRDAAAALYERALWGALAAGDDLGVAYAAMASLALAAERAPDDELGHARWYGLAQSAIARVGHRHAEAMFRRIVAISSAARGKHRRALAEAELELTLRLALHGADGYERAVALEIAGGEALALGEHDRALERLREARRIVGALVGDGSLEAARLDAAIGGALLARVRRGGGASGDDQVALAEAGRALDAAIAVRRATLGAGAPELAEPLVARARVFLAAGERGAAAATLASIDPRALAADEAASALVAGARGEVALAGGDHAAAIRAHRRALALRERRFGREHPLVGESLAALAHVHLAAGAPGRAVPLLERIAALPPADLDAGWAADRGLELARAQCATGGAHARATATGAAARYRAITGQSATALQTWLDGEGATCR